MDSRRTDAASKGRVRNGHHRGAPGHADSRRPRPRMPTYRCGRPGSCRGQERDTVWAAVGLRHGGHRLCAQRGRARSATHHGPHRAAGVRRGPSYIRPSIRTSNQSQRKYVTNCARRPSSRPVSGMTDPCVDHQMLPLVELTCICGRRPLNALAPLSSRAPRISSMGTQARPKRPCSRVMPIAPRRNASASACHDPPAVPHRAVRARTRCAAGCPSARNGSEIVTPLPSPSASLPVGSTTSPAGADDRAAVEV